MYSLVAVIVTFVRLARLWIGAPPFRLLQQANNPEYLRWLELARSSTKQWIGCTLLSGGIVFSTSLAHIGNRMLESKATGFAVLLYEIRDISAFLSLVMVVATMLFLAQWHMLVRIEALRHIRAKRANP